MLESRIFSDEKLYELLTTEDRRLIEELQTRARHVTRQAYGNKIYIRGLIEYSNYCNQVCYYCGINALNKEITRFRLTKSQIYDSIKIGYIRGFRTFVLQGGEDLACSDYDFVEIIRHIKENYPDCAVTLSIGVRSKEAYKLMKNAGADRFLLRFETSNPEAFSKLHSEKQSLERRLEALKDLKDLGYTTGTGFLVGAPFTNVEDLVEDIKLLRVLEPEMIGIGPFIAHSDTEFAQTPNGSVETTLRILSIIRLEHPYALIPSTTALNTLDENGRVNGILAGANVLMPNLSPNFAKDNYTLYDNKQKAGLESGEGLEKLKILLRKYGYEIEIGRGDYKG